MKRVIKSPNSEILATEVEYIVGNSANNRNISAILLAEQNGFCAYTEEYIGRADARDIEHFNPNLKGTDQDGYNNWFLVKHQWNLEKASKWDNLQPVLSPTAADFEERIVYDKGDYRANSENDDEAKHLIELIKLDDPVLADERKRYIKRKKDEMEKYGTDANIFFKDLIEISIKQIAYMRAIENEFDIPIVEMIKDSEN